MVEPITSDPRRRKRPLLIALVLALVMIGLVGAFAGRRYTNQRAGIYQIAREPKAAENDAEPLVMTNSGQMRGWVVNPGKQKAILYFGGNGEALSPLRADYRDLWPDRTVYLMPYPGVPPNPGSITETNLVNAALKLYDAIAPKHSDIGLAGRSLGAAVSVQVAAQRRVDRMLLITPFHRLDDTLPNIIPFVSNRIAMRDHFDSVSRASKITIPIVVVIADNDTNVPASSSLQLINAFGVRPAVVSIPNADHGNVTGGEGFLAAARAAFDEGVPFG